MLTIKTEPDADFSLPPPAPSQCRPPRSPAQTTAMRPQVPASTSASPPPTVPSLHRSQRDPRKT